MNILAIDQSLNGPGICRVLDGRVDVDMWQTAPNGATTEDKLDHYDMLLTDELRKKTYDLVVIEGVSIGSNNANHNDLVGLYYTLTRVCRRHGVPWISPAPDQVRLWAVGLAKPAAKLEAPAGKTASQVKTWRAAEAKRIVREAAAVHFQPVPSVSRWTSDMADAAWLAEIGAGYLGIVDAATEAQTKVLTVLRKTKRERRDERNAAKRKSEARRLRIEANKAAKSARKKAA